MDDAGKNCGGVGSGVCVCSIDAAGWRFHARTNFCDFCELRFPACVHVVDIAKNPAYLSLASPRSRKLLSESRKRI